MKHYLLLKACIFLSNVLRTMIFMTFYLAEGFPVL